VHVNPSTNWSFRIAGLLAVAVSLLAGCRLRTPDPCLSDNLVSHFHEVAGQVEYETAEPLGGDRYGMATNPLSVASETPREFWDLELKEAIQIALSNSTVLRDLGGTVLQTPGQARTILGPSIVETDPRFGVEAALSAFDAQLSSIGSFEVNDRAVNNELLTGGAQLFQQDLALFQTQISKRTATGAEFAFRNNTEYDHNNASRNLFGSVWDVNYEFEFRQPLGQGRGLNFNRIAGPQATPGVNSGVVIARIDTDVSLARFELGLRNLINNVENAYWELYFAYRDLDAKIDARDRALTTWRAISAQTDLPGGVADKEAYARAQYYLFEVAVQNALSGRVAQSSAGNSGLSLGFTNTAGGVYVAERRLRLLMGLPANDCRLIRPAKDPPLARVLFDWSEVTCEALTRRAELHAQQSLVERRELELVAARNFLLPRFDAVGLYRFRGFGHDLISVNRNGKGDFANAYMNLTAGDHEEWQLGFEVTVPIGFRQAHAAVRNSQLKLARARAILEEQERLIIHDLSNVMAEVDRAYLVLKLSLDRRIAAKQQLDALEERERTGQTVDLNLILDAQRRKVDADSRYFRAVAEYAVAIKNVHFAKGTLMEYNDIYLAEGPWPGSYAARDRVRCLPERLRSAFRLRQTTPLVSACPACPEPPLDDIPDVPDQQPPPPQLDLPGPANADTLESASASQRQGLDDPSSSPPPADIRLVNFTQSQRGSPQRSSPFIAPGQQPFGPQDAHRFSSPPALPGQPPVTLRRLPPISAEKGPAPPAAATK
jgi:outer membrane protein TolC